MTKNRLRSLVMILALSGLAQAATQGSLYDIPGKYTNQAGETVEFSKWRGTPLVITMTYTSCQYACPRIIEKLKNLQKLFKSKGKKTQFLIVTFDPRRDTQAQLKKHHATLDGDASGWFFLTGKETDLRKVSTVLGIRFDRNPETGDIAHDNKILITDGNGVIQQELNGLNPDVSEVR